MCICLFVCVCIIYVFGQLYIKRNKWRCLKICYCKCFLSVCMVFNRVTLGFHELRILQRGDPQMLSLCNCEPMRSCTAEIPTAISALKGSAKSAQRLFNNGREIRCIHLCSQFYLFFNVIPAPIHERIHLQKKLQLRPCSARTKLARCF